MNNPNLQNEVIPPTPAGKGAMVLTSKFQNFIWKIINRNRISRVICQTTNSDGATGDSVDATITRGDQGTVITLPNFPAGGGASSQVIYMKACLEDGSECYVPVVISGTIYALPADTPGTAPTIDAGKVPDGTVELI